VLYNLELDLQPLLEGVPFTVRRAFAHRLTVTVRWASLTIQVSSWGTGCCRERSLGKQLQTEEAGTCRRPSAFNDFSERALEVDRPEHPAAGHTLDKLIQAGYLASLAQPARSLCCTSDMACHTCT